MMKYYPRLINVLISYWTIRLISKYKPIELFDMAGIGNLQGEPFESGYIDRASLKQNTRISGRYPIVHLDVSTRRMNFRKVIDFRRSTITVMWGWYSGNFDSWQLEAKILCNMISASPKYGVEKIYVYAIHELETRTEKQGRLPFSAIGFTMTEQYQTKFLKFANENNRSETTLQQLLSSSDGTKLWEEKGFSWSGVFDLSPGSVNQKIHKEFLER